MIKTLLLTFLEDFTPSELVVPSLRAFGQKKETRVANVEEDTSKNWK